MEGSCANHSRPRKLLVSVSSGIDVSSQEINVQANSGKKKCLRPCSYASFILPGVVAFVRKFSCFYYFWRYLHLHLRKRQRL